MYGGHGCGKFYVSEYSRIEKHHADNLPKRGYTADQIEAGFERLGKVFGIYGTLLFVEKNTPFTREEILKWTVAEFKHNLRYIAWCNETEQRYGEVLEKKRKKP